MSRAIGDYSRTVTLRGQRIRVRRGMGLGRLRIPAGLILLLCATALCCVLCVWSGQRVIHSAYQISEVNRKLDALMLENRRLKLEISTLKSPGRLGLIAGRLGLHEPKTDQISHVR